MRSINKSVQQQIHRILDELHDRTVPVIVQLGYPNGFEASLAQAATEELQRDVITRAAELLPPAFSESKSESESAPKIQVRSASIPAEDQTSATLTKPLASIQSESLQVLSRACDASCIAQSRLARRGEARAKPKPLWIARALAMEVDRDDLNGLSQALNATAVFYNRPVQAPPQWRSIDTPPEVQRQSTHAWGIEKSGALAAWGAFGVYGRNVKVAVLDTGVARTHPDLASSVTNFAEFDRLGNKIAQGLDAAHDDHGHGTHVCGIIAGGCASGRWIGMAPEAELFVARVLSKSGGTDAQILAGMEWAVEQGVDVINLSLGELSFEADVLDTYTAAIFNARAAGIPTVAAMGNDGSQTTGSPANNYFALAIGATGIHDQVAGFSAGRTQLVNSSAIFDEKYLPFVYSKPELTAPGVDIFSADPAGGWRYSSGTSMAAPHVTGAIALLLSDGRNQAAAQLQKLNGAARVRTINALLMGSVEPLGEAGQDHRFGWGRLDILRAYSNAVRLGYLPPPA